MNHHCCVVMVDHFGLMIEGPSGSGKSSLTLGIIEMANRQGLTAEFVTDDQALLSIRGTSLIATAPETIRGKIEIRGYGIVDCPAADETAVHLVIRLKPDEEIERHPGNKHVDIHKIQLPLLEVPCRHEEAAVRIVKAWILENRITPN